MNLFLDFCICIFSAGSMLKSSVTKHYLFHIEASIEVSCHVWQAELCDGAHDKEDIFEMLNAMLQRPVED